MYYLKVISAVALCLMAILLVWAKVPDGKAIRIVLTLVTALTGTFLAYGAMTVPNF